MNLTRYAVKNYQFTLVILLMAAVIGLVTLFTMPRSEDPEINPPIFPVVAIYPGTSPKDMEELVAKPLEKRLSELADISKIVTEIQEGVAILHVEFLYGVNVEDKLQTVTREVDALRPSLPKDMSSLEVKHFHPSDVNILQVALVSETASYEVLHQAAKDLKTRLEKINSLKNLEYAGCPEQVIRIDLRADKMAFFKIPESLVIAAVQSELANVPGGTLQLGSKSFAVKTSSDVKTAKDLQQTVIQGSNGKLIYLRDIAAVDLRYEEQDHITRLNGHRCVLVNAAQKSKANITRTRALYEPVVHDFQKTLPRDVVMVRSFDQASNVQRRINGLGEDFLIAIGLVLLTLLPLGLRASLIVMMAIPLSLALGLVVLNSFGYSLNQISIVGLVVALGLLVDDSIVVIENIERWLREGHPPGVAAIKATQQIGMAVLGCTATLIISFLPMLFLPGAPGEFVRGLPMSVVSAVVASLLVSLTIVPFLASRLLKPHQNPEGNVILRALKRLIAGTYGRLLDRALQAPRITLLIALALFLGSAALFPLVGFKLFPASEKPMFLINVRPPLQTNLWENDRITRMVEDTLSKNQHIAYYTSNIGKGNPRIYYNVEQQNKKSDFSQIFVQLNEDTRPLEKKKIIEQIRQQFSQFPFARVEVNDFEQGPPVEAPISIRILGDNLDSLQQLSSRVEQLLRQERDLTYVTNDLNVAKTDLRVHLNKEKARALGILPVEVEKDVRLAVAGLEMGSVTGDNDDDYKVILDAPRGQAAHLDNLTNIYVNALSGQAIPLRQIADLQFEKSPTIIRHFNKQRFAVVTAFTNKGVLANSILKKLVPRLEAIRWPKGYSFSLAGEAESEKDAFGGRFTIVIVFTVCLFIAILILQFQTFKSLLIVLSVIPLGLVGGLPLLLLSGNPMSFIAIIGFIGLAGVEIKNSILLVDFTNQLRREGMPLDEAIEKAGEIRFLPVVLTSMTAIGGLIPIALNPNPQISPLALVIIGGLISSTALSRIVTPVLYKVLSPKIRGTQKNIK